MPLVPAVHITAGQSPAEPGSGPRVTWAGLQHPGEQATLRRGEPWPSGDTTLTPGAAFMYRNPKPCFQDHSLPPF